MNKGSDSVMLVLKIGVRRGDSSRPCAYLLLQTIYLGRYMYVISSLMPSDILKVAKFITAWTYTDTPLPNGKSPTSESDGVTGTDLSIAPVRPPARFEIWGISTGEMPSTHRPS